MKLKHVLLTLGAALLAVAGLQAQVPLQKALFDDELGSHWIYDDWSRTVTEAKAANKPILALFRCAP
jgi:hypothetical protein